MATPNIKVIVFLLSCVFLFFTETTSGQVNPNPNNPNNNPNGNGNGNGNGFGGAGGIIINAQGIVQPVFQKAKSSALKKRQREAYAKQNFNADLNAFQPLRKVSLVQLEAEIAKRLEQNLPLSEEIYFLAGLQRIDYLFVYPDERDLVIAGPAEGFAPDALGRRIGVTSGRPAIQLEDLVVALRAIQQGGNLGCSIDPVKERLVAFEQFVIQNSSPASSAVARRRYIAMTEVLGRQTITLWGVPEDSHFALTLVEADVLMKRISMGLEPARVSRFRSHLSMLGRKGNSMQRWWFSPQYDPFQTTEDHDVFQFAGQRAQLHSQEEISVAGNRIDASSTQPSTTAFSKQMTKRFQDLADKNPTFAELQTLFDLSVLSALIQKEKLQQRIDWDMSLFLDQKKFKVGKFFVPKEIQSCFNYKKSGARMIVGLVGGGVIMNSMQTLKQIPLQKHDESKLKAVRTKSQIPKGKVTHYWWWN